MKKKHKPVKHTIPHEPFSMQEQYNFAVSGIVPGREDTLHISFSKIFHKVIATMEQTINSSREYFS